VDSGGALKEGPYRLDVAANPQTPAAPLGALGIVLGGTEPWYEDENSGPFKNYLWQEIAYNFGYRYYVNLSFAAVEAGADTFHGLTLLDRLYQNAVQVQVAYAALQFSLFVGAPFFGVVPAGSGGFHPSKLGGKQGFYEVALSFKSRDLQASPRPWASSTW